MSPDIGKGLTSFGEIGDFGNLLPTNIAAMPIRPVFPSTKCIYGRVLL
ncbi:MAG: hypothetical protein AABZ21_00325 [Deltaproteobacteria bacterium]